MSYLPGDYVHDTTFPLAYAKDLLFAAARTREMYVRFKPKIDYFTLRIAVTPAADAPDTTHALVGETGTTKFDPLWGEAVPVENPGDTTWKQPHGTDPTAGNVIVATNPELFDGPFVLHANVRREARENELKKLGFDRIRDLLITIPTILLDESGIEAHAGDQFIWDGDRYVVMQEDSGGYWKNTNVRLYRTLNCEHLHSGS
jgi:hypothetical protein